jgi:periplasmic protein TonB
VFEHLIESKRQANVKRGMSTGFFSMVMHGGIIAGAVYATLSSGKSEDTGALDTMMVYVSQQEEQQKQEEPEPVVLDVQLKGFQTIAAPTDIPTDIPEIDLTETFDPKNYSGVGVEGGIATGVVPTGDQVYLEAVVEERPERLTGPAPQYPDLLRQAGVSGRVLVQAVIDTTGRAIPNTVKIVQTPHPGFDDAARRVMTQSLFRPGRVAGRAVKVLVSLPVDFTIKR